MPISNNTSLPGPLFAQLESAANDEHRPVEELLAEAVKWYLDERSWTRLLEYGRKQGEAAGITTEEGVDRAISDWRKENPQRGRS